MKKLLIIMTLSLSTYFLYSMESNVSPVVKSFESRFQYSGASITPENLGGLAPEPSAEMVALITGCIEYYKDILPQLIHETNAVPLTSRDRIKSLQAAVALLKSREIEVRTKWITTHDGESVEIPACNTYALRCPGSIDGQEYQAVFSGPIHKGYNLKSYNGKPWEGVLDEQDKKSETFQTPSRLAHELMLHQAINKHSITDVSTFKSYLAQIPGRKNIEERSADENTIVIQPVYDVSRYLLLKDNLNKLEGLSSKTIHDIFYAIKGGVLWDFANSALIDNDGRIVQFDLQQPNNANPAVPYYYAYSPQEKLANGMTQQEYAHFKYENDVGCGLEQFGQLLNEALKKGYNVTEQCHEYQKLVKNDPDLRQWQHASQRQKVYDAVVFEKLS